MDDDGRGFALVGPFTREDWARPRHFTVAAYDDAAAEWSALDGLGGARAATGGQLPRLEEHCGDDVLVLAGVAPHDPRYDGLAGPNVTVGWGWGRWVEQVWMQRDGGLGLGQVGGTGLDAT